MKRIYAKCALAGLLISPLFASFATATEPLERFSAGTAMIIRLKAPEESVETVATTAASIRPEYGDQVRPFGGQLGLAVQLPNLEGVDRSKDWYVAGIVKGPGKPNLVMALPVTDADALLAALPERLQGEADGNWVYYTEHNDGVPAAAASGSELKTALNEKLLEVFDSGEISAFVDVDVLAETFEPQLQMVQSQGQAVIQQIGAAMPKQPGMNSDAIVKMYSGFLQAAFQGLNDATGYAGAVTFSRAGISIEEYVEFKDGSKTSAALAGNPTGSMKSLATLPADAEMYFGLHCDMKDFMDWGWNVNGALLGDNLEKKAEFEEAKELWKDIDFREIAGSIALTDSSAGMFQYVARAEVEPIAKIRDNMQKMMELMGTIETYGMKQEMSYRPSAETVDSRPIDVVTVKQEFDESVDPQGRQQKMMESMFGKEGMVSRIAYFDDFYVQSMGGGREGMKAAIEAVESGENEAVTEALGQLNGESNFVGLVDVPRLISFVAQTAGRAGQTPPNVDFGAIEGLDLESNYVGASVTLEENSIHGKGYVPTKLIADVIEMVELMKQ